MSGLPPNAQALAQAKAGADEARALLEAGAITPAEHQQLLGLMWQVQSADNHAGIARARQADQAMHRLKTLGDSLNNEGAR
jgi:hypothetical protein